MKKLFIISLCCALALQTTLPVFAADTESASSTKESILSGETLDNVFQDMKNSLKNGEEVSFSQSLEKVGGLSISTEPQYDLSDTSLDFNNLEASLTNLGFSKLSASLAGSFNFIDLSGKAAGCVSLFENTFGSVSDMLTLNSPTFPKEFSVDDMLKASQNSINSQYSTVTSTNEFQSIKNNISIGDIFTKAHSEIDNSSSGTAKTIAAMEEELGIDTQNNSSLQKYNSQIESIDKNLNSELSDVQANFKDMTTLVAYKNTVDEKIAETEEDRAEAQNTATVISQESTYNSPGDAAGAELGKIVSDWLMDLLGL